MNFSFSKSTLSQRLDELRGKGILTSEDLHLLKQSNTSYLEMADKLVENVIGVFTLPYSILPHLWMDSKEYYVPMVIEESSVVAAVSSAIKWVRTCGEITTSRPSRYLIGQIHFIDVQDLEALQHLIEDQRQNFITLLNEQITKSMHARGGGIQDIYLRVLPQNDQQQRAVVHLILDPCDAMGANLVNQACEFLRSYLLKLRPNENPLLCILSNLNDQALVRCKVTLSAIDPELASKIEAASMCAWTDPYRAATHNKGIFNGIDGVLMATGNDWRAVEAGGHAYAARQGAYQPLSRWYCQKKALIGELEMPMNVGIVGGVTNTVPLTKLSLRMMNVTSADELARVIASVGLLQNLAALRALVTTGITQGHMNLHLKNWLLSQAQSSEEYTYGEQKLQQLLKINKTVLMSDVIQVLEEFRKKNNS